jgi:hypothetical protein
MGPETGFPATTDTKRGTHNNVQSMPLFLIGGNKDTSIPVFFYSP